MSEKNLNHSGRPKRRQSNGPTRSSPGKRPTVLNWRVLLWTLVGLIVGGAGAWLWHAWQVKDFASGALRQGRELEAKAEDLAGQARGLVAEAGNLEAEARDLQSQGKSEEAQGRNDKAQDLFRKVQKLTEEAFQDRQAAMQYYLRYTELNPNDPAGPLSLASLSRENGNLPSAIDWYATALQAAANQPEPWPQEIEVRTLRAELLLSWAQAFQLEASRTQKSEYRDSAEARFRQAQDEAGTVLAQENVAPENESKANRVLGLSLFGLQELGVLDRASQPIASVGDVLDQAFRQNPADSELALALARVYREFPELLSEPQRASFGSGDEQEQKRLAAADNVMRHLVDAAEQSLENAAAPDEARIQAANAHLSRYRYLASYGLPGTNADLERALELAPDSAAVHILAGWQLMEEAAALQAADPGSIVTRKDKLDEACRHFLTAKDSEFGNLTVYLGLSEAYRRLGKTDEAVATYRLGLQNVGENDWDLNTALIDALLDAQKLTQEEADKRFKALDDALVAQRASLGETVRRSREAHRDLLRARWLVQTNELESAVTLLGRLLTDRSLAPSGGKTDQTVNRDEVRARLLLVQCYEAQARQKLATAAEGTQAVEPLKTTSDAIQLPQVSAASQAARDEANSLFRKAAEVYEELARDLPQMSQFREAAGRLYLAAGQPDVAVLNLRRGIELDDSLGLRFLLARARLEQAKSASPSMQVLEAVETEIGALEERVRQEPIAQPWAVDLMRADLLALRRVENDSETSSKQVLSALRATEEEYPLSSELRDALAVRYQELDAADDLARVSTCREIVTALSTGRAPDALVPEEKLRQLVDQDAILWRFYHANRLLMDAAASQNDRRKQIQEAAQLAEGLLKDRPDWPQAHLLAASVKRAEGNLVDAVQDLEEAWELEPTNLRTLEQLVRLQLQVGQVEQAEARIAEARAKFPGTDAILQLEMLVKRGAGDRQKAIELARQEITARPEDPAARMRLGALLQEAGETDQAEKMFREALLIKPGDPGPMTALFALYGKANKKDEAEATLKELAASGQLKPWQRELVLARGYETLKQPEKSEPHYVAAEAAYRKALEATPDDIALRLELIDLLLRGEDPARFDRAEGEVQKILKTTPDSADARRAQARVLWLRDKGDDRQKALAIYDVLAAAPEQGTQSDRYRRAEMLESLGEFAAAGEAFDEVIESAALTTEAIAAQIGRYFRTGQLAKAEAELVRLEKMAPGAVGTISLRVQLLHQTDRDSEIEPIISHLQQRLEEHAAADPALTAQASQLIGDLYSSVDMPTKAEPHYRKLVESNPAAVVRLAACLAAQGRTGQATEMILAADGVTDLAKAAALCGIFVSSQPTDDDWKAAEPVLEAAAKAHEDSAELLSSIANVYIVRKQTDKAVAFLEKASALKPENVVILNNLAAMLGEQPGRAGDALEYINRAIKLSSYAPGLLDTKGTILIHLERADEAITVLDQAVSGNVQDPRYRLHLAVACDRVGDGAKAKQMLQKALEDGLLQRSDLILTGKDKVWLDQLRAKFDL